MGEEESKRGNCMELLKTLDRDEILEVLSEGFCTHCDAALLTRIQSLANKKAMPVTNNNATAKSEESQSADLSGIVMSERISNSSNAKRNSEGSKRSSESVSWRRQDGLVSNVLPTSVNIKLLSFRYSESDHGSLINFGLSEEQEMSRFQEVSKKKDFSLMERSNGKIINVLQGLELHTGDFSLMERSNGKKVNVLQGLELHTGVFSLMERSNGKIMNVLQGLELHTGVFNSEEQRKIVDCVLNLQQKGQKGQLRERTYSEPRKWKRGKGRVTIQFGCCYNYEADSNGNPPGIVRDEEVDPLPPLFKEMIKRMVRWHVLSPNCVPDSCIVNIYDEGDCIPPHIDHHDFLRPFCTVSLLSECNILFGTNLKVVSPGEFSGPYNIPLPLGSVLILNGNAADIAKHCVPGVPSKRISITFRKMDRGKIPYGHVNDPQLSGIEPLEFSPSKESNNQLDQEKNKDTIAGVIPETMDKDFPPLDSLNFGNGQRRKKK
ncbi:hypothetical protein ACH5RR_001920 [Cinchona calisaya]|uniref:Fe2OG dioxygenase domain-containing protein n=1 Tax=Cinchona calisaya TaxID=153742 RepID=A0ABD3B539_9GENT